MITYHLSKKKTYHYRFKHVKYKLKTENQKLDKQNITIGFQFFLVYFFM